MGRITQKDLENLVNRINVETGNNVCSHTKNADGTYTANVGTYLIDYAYGGVTMYKVTNAGGGVSEVFGSGHMTKSSLYNHMRAFIAGVEERDIIIK